MSFGVIDRLYVKLQQQNIKIIGCVLLKAIGVKRCIGLN